MKWPMPDRAPPVRRLQPRPPIEIQLSNRANLWQRPADRTRPLRAHIGLPITRHKETPST